MSESGEPIQSVAGGSAVLSKGEIFEVLQNKRRRYVIQYLRRHGGPVDLGDLATQVASWEYETPPDDVSKKQRKRVYTTLQQTHLPKMDEADIVTYDSNRGVIGTTPLTDDLTVYLEIVPGSEFPWREYYLSVGAMALAVVATLWAEIYPFTAVPTIAWMALFALVLTASAGYHVHLGREMTLSEYETPPDEAK